MARARNPEIRFVLPGTEEWMYLWGRLRRRFGSVSCRDPVSGEVWQYMGTVCFSKSDLETRGMEGERPGWFHEFRHRLHASRRYYRGVSWRCRASDSYQSFEDFRVKQERVNRYA